MSHLARTTDKPVPVDPTAAPPWLRHVPDRALARGRACTQQLERHLAAHELPRPTLWHLEAERARRGIR